MTDWGDIFGKTGASWEDVLVRGERAGGPSPTGNSYWSDFRLCEYLFAMKHVKRWKLRGHHPRYENLTQALEIGGLYHEARARYYLENLKFFDSKGNRTQYGKGMPQTEIDNACLEAMFDIVNRAEAAVPGYAAQVRRFLEGWLALHGPGTALDNRNFTMYVEQLAEVGTHGFLYSTRFDRIYWCEKQNGPVIQEIKTAKMYSETLLTSYKTDPQMIGQMYCYNHSDLRKKHGPLKGFLIDLCIKTKERRYPTHEVPINLKLISNWVKDMKYLNMLRQQCTSLNMWPRRFGNCIQWMRPCEFHEHCSSLTKEKNRYYRKKKKGDY